MIYSNLRDGVRFQHANTQHADVQLQQQNNSFVHKKQLLMFDVQSKKFLL